MNDLIRRSDAIAAFIHLSQGAMEGLIYKRTIDAIPAVDAVEVVRCRECVHYNNNHQMYDDDVCEIMHYCDGTPRTACEEDFCSYGKRREDDVG